MEIFLTCIAAAQVTLSCNNEEACKSCSTNEDEREVHWHTPRGEANAWNVSQFVE